MTTFGEYAVEDQGLDLEEGEHRALITHVEMPKDEQGNPLESFGKNVVDITFAIEGNEKETARRRYSISFGQNNTTGAWAAFAELLAAATGIVCGDKNQRKLGIHDLEGQWCRVVLKRVEKNGKTYLNVVEVLSPKKERRQATEPAKPDFAFKRTEEEDEIPF